jgi:glycosyltransferase involved in cell wall biosynthesis
MATMSTAEQTDVAVVIPVGSVDAGLTEQLRAVLAQQLVEPFEVVLSRNTPADIATLERMVADLGDTRVRIVDSSDRPGAAHARNVGIAAVVGQRVAFCDADDLVHDGWLSGLMAGLVDYDAVSGQVVDVFLEERMATWHPPATPGGLPQFLGVPYVLTGNLAVWRAAFAAVGGFDETLTRCEDIALGWALLRSGHTVGYAPNASIDYRHRPGRWSMLRQHYFYGRGMSEVLVRYGVPSGDAWSSAGGLRMLRPNSQHVSRRTVMGTMRRVSLGVGRVSGLVQSRARKPRR